MLAFLLAACAGGVPRVPASPDAVLTNADQYFARKKYFQAQHLYKSFLQRYPGHARSDHAQFMLAESMFADEDYALAAVEYRILISNYGYSDYVDDAYLREALCLYYQSPRIELDQRMSEDALNKLKTFPRVFPNSPLVVEAQRYIDEINTKLAKKALDTGVFYLNLKRFDAARIYFDKVITQYPDNIHYAWALYYMGYVQERLLDFDEAQKYYQMVLDYPADLKKLKKLANEGMDRTYY